jgi:hypothetical protein
VERDCVDRSGANYCGHARQYYPSSVTGDPPIFWIFDDTLLPSDVNIIQKTSGSGDACHYNLDNISNGKLGKLVSRTDPRTMYICDSSGGYRLITDQDIASFDQKFEAATSSSQRTPF